MQPPTIIFSLSCCAAAVVSAGAIPQQPWLPDGLARRQTKIATATIPTFSYGPSSTIYLGGGSSENNTASTSTSSAPPASDTPTSIPTGSTDVAISSTVPGTVRATGTVPTYSFFPSSTVLVSPGSSDQPSAGNGSGNRNGNAGGDRGAGTGNGGQPQLRQDLVDLLQGLLDFLGR